MCQKHGADPKNGGGIISIAYDLNNEYENVFEILISNGFWAQTMYYRFSILFKDTFIKDDIVI